MYTCTCYIGAEAVSKGSWLQDRLVRRRVRLLQYHFTAHVAGTTQQLTITVILQPLIHLYNTEHDDNHYVRTMAEANRLEHLGWVQMGVLCYVLPNTYRISRSVWV